jgi:hypothetical protein
MKRLFLSFVFIFSLPLSPFAADWRQYDIDESTNNSYSIDRSSFHMIENRNAKFDIKVDVNNDDQSIKTIIWTERADCVNKKHRAEKETLYYRDGRIVGPNNPGGSRSEWSDTPKNSLCDFICIFLFGEIN